MSEKAINVRQVSGGYVLDWSDPSLDDRESISMALSYPPRKPVETRGTQVFTDRKKLLARIKSFLGV